MKKIVLVMTVMILSLAGLMAQQTVSGIITDAQTGQPIQGAVVVVDGTTIGIITGADGAYSLNAPAGAEKLLVSFVGMRRIEIPLDGSASFNVAMAEDILQLDEVVVTALGISRDKKALGYAVEEIDGDVLVGSHEPNLMSALSGKIAGLQVNSSNGTPGAGTYIVLRGATSFQDINQPLIVVDGIPIDNSTNYTGDPNNTSRNNNLQGVTNSNRGIDINPNDIASVTVLKGPAATALYGSRAANGAIMLTTKRGSKSGKMQVSFKTSLGFDEVNKLPEVQKTYSQGSRGAYNNGTSLSWGADISTLGEVVNPLGQTVTAQAYDNDFNKFFETGVTSDNSLSFSGGNLENSFYASAGYLNQTGVIPGTEFSRVSIRFNGESKVAEKLTARVFANYVNSGGTRIQQGSNLSNPLFTLWPAPPTWDLYGLPFENEDGTMNNYRLFFDNPRWATVKNPHTDNVDRMTGNFQLDYDALPWLNILYRIGTDFYSDRRKQIYAVGSWEANTIGRVYEEQLNNTEVNSDLIARVTQKLTDGLNMTLTVGNNVNVQDFQRLFIQGDGLTIPNFYNLSNATGIITTEILDRQRSVSLYYDAQFDYEGMLYLSTTGRNDWTSTLPVENRSFFYPSVSASFVFTEALGMANNKILPYGKFRASWAQSGNGAPVYALQSVFVTSSPGDGWTSGLLFPLTGTIPGFTLSSTIGNPDLRPEKTEAIEVGLDLKFLGGRLGLDAAYYDQVSTDQIFQQQFSASTGAVARLVNAGKITNKGLELTAYGTPIKTRNFTWEIHANFTRNRSMVVEIGDGIDRLSLGGFTAPQAVLQAGEPYGALFGSAYQRDELGNIEIDDDPNSPTYGYPIIAANNQIIGNTQPDFLVNIRNSLTWKGFRLSALLDIREGGDIYAGTTRLLRLYGAAKETESREVPVVLPGVKANEGGINDISVPLGQTYYQTVISNLDEANVYDASWVRLREVNISYSVPSAVLGNSPFSEMTITAGARNLWLSTDYPNLDPEVSLTGANFGQGLEYMSPPNTKGYSVALNLSF